MVGTDAGRDSGTTRDGGGGGDGTLALEVLHVLEGGETEPAAGARAVLDRPGGGQEELAVGADGRVTFEGLDFSLGKATVTFWDEGYVLTAITNVGEAGVPAPIHLLRRVEPGDVVTVSGTVSGMMDAAMNTLVMSTTTGGFYNGGPSYSMEVPTGEAGEMVVFEYSSSNVTRGSEATLHQAVTVPLSAPAADTTIDFDFATPATLTTVSGSIPAPSSLRGDSALNTGEVFIRVSGNDIGGAFLGTQTRFEESASGFDYDLSFVELAAAAEPYTAFIVNDLPEQSLVFVEGWPTAGMQDIELLDPPTVLEPDFGVDLAWSATVRWESVDLNDVGAAIQVFDQDLDRLRAVTLVVPGVGSARLPQLPSGVTMDDVLGGGTPEARVALCDPRPARPWTCDRIAVGRAFGVTP
jgi:hypothetical protein